MEFDISRVYTAVNAEKVPVGSRVFLADTLADLKAKVEQGTEPVILQGIEPDDRLYRFMSVYPRNALAYLVEAPIPLKWTDLKVGDILEKDNTTAMVTLIDADHEIHVHINSCPMSDEGLEHWRKVEK